MQSIWQVYCSIYVPDFEIAGRADVFSGAPQESSASSFGTLGINFRARKAHNDEEWAVIV